MGKKIKAEQAEMLSGVLDVASAQHVTKQEIRAQVVMSFTQDHTAPHIRNQTLNSVS